MSGHTLVVEGTNLVPSFKGATFVVCTDELSRIPDIWRIVREGNTLAALKLVTPVPLSRLHLEDDWCDIPLAVYLPALGKFKDCAERLDRLKAFNLRLFFPAQNKESYIACRILSSFGIATGLTFDSGEPDWEALADLATYALYGKAPHTPIEPFHTLVNHYDPAQRTSWDTVYFDDPERYLHLSEDGQVALCRAKLLARDFITERLGDLPTIRDSAAYQEERESWRTFFLEEEGCAWCEFWRICLGKFNGICADRTCGCQPFFRELLDAADERRALKKKEKTLWQP